MSDKNYSKLNYYVTLAKNGTKRDIDVIMKNLNKDITIADSEFIDYALSHVQSDEGIERVFYYLLNGTQIQRNYCTLFFNRRDEWDRVKVAYKMGLIDEIQAFSR